jgi:hypothetical protein
MLQETCFGRVKMQRGGQPRVWILVADAQRARVVMPDVAEGRFSTYYELDASPPPLGARQDPHRLGMPQFSTELAQLLNTEVARDAYDQLVLIAPGSMVHDLHAALSARAAERVVGMVHRDLTRLSDYGLSAYVEPWWLAPAVAA